MVREFLSPANARKRPYQIREELDSSVPIGSWVPFFLIIIFFFFIFIVFSKGYLFGVKWRVRSSALYGPKPFAARFFSVFFFF